MEVRKTVTVLFADVTGSTTLGERLDPESLRGVMSRYFDEMRSAVEAHRGTVEKFIGDAVMAVFGVPAVHEDDALRAVRAASQMREALVSLNADLERDWGARIQIRTGINTGAPDLGAAVYAQGRYESPFVFRRSRRASPSWATSMPRCGGDSCARRRWPGSAGTTTPRRWRSRPCAWSPRPTSSTYTHRPCSTWRRCCGWPTGTRTRRPPCGRRSTCSGGRGTWSPSAAPSHCWKSSFRAPSSP